MTTSNLKEPRQLRKEGNKGGQPKVHTPVESPDSLHSRATAKVLLAIGEGEFEGGITPQDIYLNGTPLADANGAMNFQGVTWDFRTGTQTQTPIPGLNNIANETQAQYELKQGTPWTKRFDNLQLDAVRIRLGFPRMALQKDNGDTIGAKVEYRILLSVDDGPYQVYSNYTADGKTTSLYERGHLVNLPKATAHWDVRVERITPDSTSQMLNNTTNIEAYTEIVFAQFRYPNTALLYVTFDSKSFGGSIPKISVRCKGRRVRIPRNYDPITRIYAGVWDGTFKWAWTDNPAWIWLDVIVESRFGAGEHMTIDNVNKWELYRISQYCDQMVPNGSGGTEPRHTCNVYVQTANAAYSVIRDFANIFNGFVGYQGTQAIVRADMPDDVVKVVNNANIIGGRFTYSGGSVKDRATIALVSFSNPDNHYDDDVEAVSDTDLRRRYGNNEIQLTAIGCTRRSEAQRRGRWAIASNASDRSVKYNTGLEGLSYKIGDVIAVSDVFVSGHRMGGRVKSAAGSMIELDAIPKGLGIGAKLYVNTGGGTAEVRTIRGFGTGNIVLVDSNFTTLPKPDEVWTLDAASFNGGQALSLQYFRVLQILDKEDGTYEVSGLFYNPGKYAAIDGGTRIPKPHYSDIPGAVVPAPTNVAITSYTKIVQGLSVQTLRVQWDRVTGAVEYEMQWRRDSNDWVNAPISPSLGFEVDGIYSGDYQARVRAINGVGASSNWAEAVPVRLNGKDGDVPPLQAMTTSPLPWAIQVDWLYSPGSEDGSHVELEYSPNGQDTWQKRTDVVYPGTRYVDFGLKAGAVLWYRGRVIDKLGNQSAWSDPVKGESSSEADDYLIEITGDYLSADDGKQLQQKIGDNLEAILANAVANNATVMHQLAKEGQFTAEILDVRTTVATVDSALADFTTVVKASFEDQYAAIQQKMTSKFDHNGGSALYSLQAGINLANGTYVDAGMTLGVVAGPNNTYTSRIGFKADQFVMISGSTPYSPFAIVGGQVFINSAFIQNASITNAKIVDAAIDRAKIAQEIGSDNWYSSGAQQGWMINKDGRAYFRQVEVTGTVNANSGNFHNVTIWEDCNIRGTLWARQINGPLMQAKSFTFSHGTTNAQSIIYWDGTAGRGDVPMTISGRILRSRNNSQTGSRVEFNGQQVPATLAIPVTGASNVNEYSFSYDVGTGGASIGLYAGALNQGQGENCNWSVQLFAAPTANQFHT